MCSTCGKPGHLTVVCRHSKTGDAAKAGGQQQQQLKVKEEWYCNQCGATNEDIKCLKCTDCGIPNKDGKKPAVVKDQQPKSALSAKSLQGMVDNDDVKIHEEEEEKSKEIADV